MADPQGFIKYERKEAEKRAVKDRINDYREIYQDTTATLLQEQSARCMSCGIPFCHSSCPLGNRIPDFNQQVHEGHWYEAYKTLTITNNFPEFTGRICPAPCEASCVLGLNQDAVTIEMIEKQIIEAAFQNGWVIPSNSSQHKNKKIAIIGSGPSGLAAADELCKLGYTVSVYEKSNAIGGLLRYGIPDFKLEKWVIDRRIKIMESSGVKFFTNCEIGSDIALKELYDQYDAVALCIGAGVPRDLTIAGRSSSGVYFAMDFLTFSNQYVSQGSHGRPDIDVQGKNVVVIGGGDTGADCVGTSHRQGAASVTQIEVMFKPGSTRGLYDPWPLWPMTLRTSSSHEEGGYRTWSVLTKRFIHDEQTHLTGIEIVQVQWQRDKSTGQYRLEEIANSDMIIPCDVALIAVGFLHGQTAMLNREALFELDTRGNIVEKQYMTKTSGIFAAGDVRRGQSLVVWAIEEGRECANAIDKTLTFSEEMVTMTAESYKM